MSIMGFSFEAVNCESVIAFATGFSITSLQHVKWMSHVGVRFVEYIITPGTGCMLYIYYCGYSKKRIALRNCKYSQGNCV